MQQGRVVDLDAALAMSAARFGVEHKLPLADSIVCAVADHVAGHVWTQDEHFDGLDRVHFFARHKRG